MANEASAGSSRTVTTRIMKEATFRVLGTSYSMRYLNATRRTTRPLQPTDHLQSDVAGGVSGTSPWQQQTSFTRHRTWLHFRLETVEEYMVMFDVSTTTYSRPPLHKSTANITHSVPPRAHDLVTSYPICSLMKGSNQKPTKIQYLFFQYRFLQHCFFAAISISASSAFLFAPPEASLCRLELRLIGGVAACASPDVSGCWTGNDVFWPWDCCCCWVCIA
jgi:hypothetical protein